MAQTKIKKLEMEIQKLRNSILNFNITNATQLELEKQIKQTKLNQQKIRYRRRKINVLRGFAPSSV